MEQVTCPVCKTPMRLRLSRALDNEGLPRRIWACTTIGCDVVHGTHPDGSPLGVPGDRDTRRARQRAHHEFDRYWRARNLTRTAAYRMLQQLLGLSEEAAHIAKLDRLQCLTLIVRIRRLEESATRKLHELQQQLRRQHETTQHAALGSRPSGKG